MQVYAVKHKMHGYISGSWRPEGTRYCDTPYFAKQFRFKSGAEKFIKTYLRDKAWTIVRLEVRINESPM